MVWTALLRLSPLPTVSQQWKSFAEINRRGSLCNYLSVSYIRFSISLAKYSFTFMVGMLRDMLDFVKFDYVRSIVHKCIIFFMDNELSLFSQLHLNVCARNFVILYRLFAWCCLICSEVHVEGLETLDYFDNLSQRERYSEQAVAITFDTESNARNKLQQFQLKTSERSMQHSSEVLICHVQDLHKYRSNLTMDCGNREPGS